MSIAQYAGCRPNTGAYFCDFELECARAPSMLNCKRCEGACTQPLHRSSERSIKAKELICREYNYLGKQVLASKLFMYAVLYGALLAAVHPAHLPVFGSGPISLTADMPATYLRRAYEVESLPGFDGQFPSQHYSGVTCFKKLNSQEADSSSSYTADGCAYTLLNDGDLGRSQGLPMAYYFIQTSCDCPCRLCELG